MTDCANTFTLDTLSASSDDCIRVVSAPCSAGKSHAIRAAIVKEYPNERYLRHRPTYYTGMRSKLIVIPTLQLLQEYELEFRKMGANPVIITTNTDPKEVRSTLTRHLKDFGDMGIIVLTTHAAYFGLRYCDIYHRCRTWDVYIDETPSFDTFFYPKLPRSHPIFQKYLTVDRDDRLGDLLRVIPNNYSALRRYLKQPRDDGEAEARRIFQEALNPNKILYVHEKDWDRVIVNQSISLDVEEANSVRFLSVLSLHGFKGATWLSANLEKSPTYKFFTKMQNVEVETNVAIQDALRFKTYPVTTVSRLSVKYLIKGRGFSKYLRDVDNKTLLTEMEDVIIAELERLGNPEFLLACNEDYKMGNGRLLQVRGCHPISANPLGLNSFDNFNVIVFIAALNRPPQHSSCLKSLGITDETQRTAMHESAHQAVMRTSLRRQDSTDQVTAIVADEDTALYLNDSFGGSLTLSKLGKGMTYEKKARKSDAERAREYRNRKKFQTQAATRVGGLSGDRPLDTQQRHILLRKALKETCDGFQLSDDAIRGLELTVAELETANSLVPECLSECLGDLLEALQRLNAECFVSKNGRPLYNLTRFDGEGRSSENAVSATGMILDFDNGNLAISDFEALFGGVFPFVVYNSYSRCEGMPNKYHVLVPFSRPARIKELEFQACVDAVIIPLEEVGYTRAGMAVDPMCWKPTQFFYVPSRRSPTDQWAYYKEHLTGQLLDPSKCLARHPQQQRRRSKQQSRPHSSTTAKQKALSEVQRQHQGRREGRRIPIYWAGQSLTAAGFNEDEIKQHLRDIFGDDSNAVKHIEGTIVTLKKDGRL